jgi:serine/threonine protein kinase
MYSSPWRIPTGSQRKPDKNPFRLPRVHSMANIHQSWGYDQERPFTSTSASSSFNVEIMSPTIEADHDDSRTPTPTNASFLAFTAPAFGDKSSPPTSPTNPWSKILSARRTSPPHSPSSSSNSQSPDSMGRSGTPIAPQPLRPFLADKELLPGRDEMPTFMPFSPFPIGSQALGSLNPFAEGDKLPEQFITSELIQKEHRRILNIVQKQTWSAPTKKLVYQWILQNPRTAMLLWMCDDLQAWPKAFIMGLEDRLLPYTEEQLEGKAANPRYAVQLQWRVAIKQLPREGRHTEFHTHETVPLQEDKEVRIEISESSKHLSKRMDCVRWCDSDTPEVYVRKRLDVKAKPDKDAILSRIKEYQKLSHPNIAKIIASYARGQTVAFLTLRTEANLSDYLATFAGRSESMQVLTWISDLASAVQYIHSQGISHRSIRPHKILVDLDARRITLAPFGIATPARSASSTLFTPYSSDPAYIYAAPEALIHRREIASSSSPIAASPADVWSLGCVMLEMATAARGTPVDKLHAYCAAESHDPSYHANWGRAHAWTELMSKQQQQTPPSGRSSSSRSDRRERVAAAIATALVAVQSMLAEKADERPSMRQVVTYLEEGRVERGRKDHRGLGFDVGAELARGGGGGGGVGVWGDLESLNGYYMR